jgi:hypothetical protein
MSFTSQFTARSPSFRKRSCLALLSLPILAACASRAGAAEYSFATLDNPNLPEIGYLSTTSLPSLMPPVLSIV